MIGDPRPVLVVDDSELNRDMLSRRLERRGFHVVLAAGGAEALEIVERTPLEAVLLDVMMPGMDGWQVLSRVRAVHPLADLPIIMITAKDRSEDIVHALELGANDYVTKPLDFPVVVARLQTQITLKRAKRDLEVAHARMKKDLDAAAKLQQALIPQSLPAIDGARFAWRFRPCTELAGDIFDIVRIDDGTVGVYLVDVCGHGVPAALLSVTLSRVLSHMADRYSPLQAAESGGPRPPADVAAWLNRRFPMDVATSQYFTFFYVTCDVASRRFRYVTAGHPAPIHAPVQGNPVCLPAGGFAIGWFPDCAVEETAISLAPGDRLFFYSDGLVEAKNDHQELFDAPRLLDAITRTRTAPIDSSLQTILDDVLRWCGDEPPDDDISLVGIEFC